MKNFENKVAAITGAGSGMGRTLALDLARRGCHLALSDVNEAGLAETVQLVAAASPSVKVTSQRLDVADRAAMVAWADQVVADHGKANLIFNNAGVGLGATVSGMKIEDFEWLMNINFWGVVYGTQAFLPHLKAAGEGHVINTSSLFGLLAVPSQSAYNAAKFAVRGFTESLRQELDMLDCGVSATSVHPGGIKTAIARNARMDSSVRAIGMDEQTSGRKFEKNFITTAEKAAAIILRAVERDQRRVLVGPDAVLLDKVVRLFPSAYQRFTTYFARKQMS
ncbi:SDR family NAD(P)-dependent oxidoreductase [Flagellatimonas centrodinii]|uniref:SDR family NAD(P)-dependent oxidoreductase n=1 Tax=Flagellatimonas centrodinii TaxID=2806210 RepID=UPI001FEEB04D|nr:SDR family NAD(P)-dependent oxidoreductase [Flagellatimonas centrodinii]ULQ46598.1 SDR family NAD(P)-dependent oxidoreductase [Flagellatimonas centrodinii]